MAIPRNHNYELLSTKLANDMKYKIDVHSIGYEDTSLTVEADTLKQAKWFEQQARVEWCNHNAIDLDSLDLPFTRTTKTDQHLIK